MKQPGENGFLGRARGPALGLLLALGAQVAHAAPSASWTVRGTRNDCFGSASQGTPACYSYALDLYENINYSFTQAGTADIQIVNVGFDATYFYVDFDFVLPWSASFSTGHQVVIEFDTNAGSEVNRGDYYVGIYQKSEFNSTSWVDAHASGGYETYQDTNNDVGGANPLTSDYGGSPGDGYQSNITGAVDLVWARIVGGNFQVAVRRSLVGSPTDARLRVWSRQSTNLSKDKLYFHDQNNSSDVNQIDNLAGLGTSAWVAIGGTPSLIVVKTSQTTSDPFNGTTNPKSIPGAFVTYSVTVTNTGIGAVDANTFIVLDAIPTNTDLFVGDMGAPGSGPVIFVNGVPSSGLTYTFTSLASVTDDVSFSNNGGVSFVYTPVPNGNGVDPAVTHIRINPKGTMPGNLAGNPSLQLSFRVRVE